MRLWPCIFGLAPADKVPLINYEIQGEIRGLDKCDLQQLEKPKYAVRWSCDKPIENEKVPKLTKCEIVCPDGYDIIKGKRRASHICRKDGTWQKPEKVLLFCVPSGKFCGKKIKEC